MFSPNTNIVIYIEFKKLRQKHYITNTSHYFILLPNLQKG